jgi:putative heme transporter
LGRSSVEGFVNPSDRTVVDFAPPALDVRALARKAAAPALLAALAVTAILLVGGPGRAFVDAVGGALGADPAWVVLGAACEWISLAGYIGLLWLIAGGATPRVGWRESAQITLAGAAATRLLPTAGAGGATVSLWALRRAGLAPLAAARTLLTFMVVLYSVFLASIALSGTALTFGLVRADGPTLLSAIPAGAAVLIIVIAVGLSSRGATMPDDGRVRESGRSTVGAAAQLLGGAVRDAVGLVRGGDPRLLCAVAAWGFDAAVLWAMLRAFGSVPAVAVMVLAYFVGQAANTVPIPGAVSGGIAGVLIAFGIPAAALTSVLA